MSDEITIRDVPERRRYEATVGGASEPGVVHYALRGTTIELTHTEVPQALEGRGVGSALARFALDDARQRGLSVIPTCPFIAGYIERHPEYAGLVAGRGDTP